MRSNFRAFLVWLAPAVVVALAVARVSVWIQPHFAPLVLYPLLLGALMGSILCGLLQLAQLRNFRLALAGAVAVAIVAAMAEHGFFYLDRSREYTRKALEAGVPEEVLTSPTFLEYMHDQATMDSMMIPLWIGNALVMAAAAGGMVVWYLRYGRPTDLHPNPLARGEGTDPP